MSEEYAHSMIVLQEAKSVKFTDFVTPGNTLRMRVEQLKREGSVASFKFEGQVEERTCVSGRLSVECFNLAESDPSLAELDKRMIAHQRGFQAILTRGMNQK
jgi:3-hydroxyacyl-[acyl-carrier-protein] dehydratase